MNFNFILFCKSYRNDVLRFKKLIESVLYFNKEKIPFFLSLPKDDIEIFEKYISFIKIEKQIPFFLVTDQEIAIKSHKNGLNYYKEFSGYLHQQVIKSEAWKLIGCENYLCLDSDSYFTNTFRLSNFIHNDGEPYSLLHEANDLLSIARKLKKFDVINNYLKDSNQMKLEFSREGPNYDFGPPPMIWSRKVWESLQNFHLTPRNENLWLAIKRIPAEIRWYGEALLKFNAIPIHPIDPLFNFYHYSWQYKYLKKYPPKREFIGETLQSNWDLSLISEFENRSTLSILWKKLTRHFKDRI